MLRGRIEVQVPGCLLLSVALLACACAGTQEGKAPETVQEKASYGIGLEMGRNFKHQEFAVDRDLLMRGVEDGLSGAEPILNQEELQAAVLESQRQAVKAIGERNRAEGEAFLAANRDRAGVMVLPGGLQYEKLEEGEGPVPTRDAKVVIRYRGTFLDGTEFENTGSAEETETVAVETLIPALREALLLMPVGSKWRLFAPPELALGQRGSGRVGPNTTLIFEVELVGIESRE